MASDTPAEIRKKIRVLQSKLKDRPKPKGGPRRKEGMGLAKTPKGGVKERKRGLGGRGSTRPMRYKGKK